MGTARQGGCAGLRACRWIAGHRACRGGPQARLSPSPSQYLCPSSNPRPALSHMFMFTCVAPSRSFNVEWDSKEARMERQAFGGGGPLSGGS